MKTVAILLAAGNSKRFGAVDKLAADFNGLPLIAHAAQTLRSFAPDHLVAVISNAALGSELGGFKCVTLNNDGASQSASLRAGIEFAIQLQADRAIVALADMPFVSVSLLNALRAQCTDAMAAAATEGIRRSPPVCFPKSNFKELSKMTGDQGARALLDALPVEALVSTDKLELADIDDPDDLARYSNC